jgi:hypothetical protein
VAGGRKRSQQMSSQSDPHSYAFNEVFFLWVTRGSFSQLHMCAQCSASALPQTYKKHWAPVNSCSVIVVVTPTRAPAKALYP